MSRWLWISSFLINYRNIIHFFVTQATFPFFFLAFSWNFVWFYSIFREFLISCFYLIFLQYLTVNLYFVAISFEHRRSINRLFIGWNYLYWLDGQLLHLIFLQYLRINLLFFPISSQHRQSIKQLFIGWKYLYDWLDIS